MKLFIMLLISTFLASFCFASESANVDTLVADNNAFAFSLYRQLSAASGNVCISPYSVSSALAMAYAGARENTAKQIAAALRFPSDEKRARTAFKNLTSQLLSSALESGQKLSIANGLCVTGKSPASEFTQLLKTDYGAEVLSGNVDTVNAWVKRKTEGTIEKILDDLSPNSLFVLLNAVYFKGIWETPFKKEYTREMPFTVAIHKQVNAPFMYKKKRFKLLSDPELQAISIPYKGDRLSMIVLLPNATDGLPALEKQVNAGNLTQWIQRMQPSEVDCFLPKFRLSEGCDLVPYCKALGIRDAFAEKSADFSGMGFKKGECWISRIRHKACIAVDEEGTEAAGATAVEMRHTAIAVNPLIFKADHPFVFVIRDNETGTILFLGRVADPTKSGG